LLIQANHARAARGAGPPVVVVEVKVEKLAVFLLTGAGGVLLDDTIGL